MNVLIKQHASLLWLASLPLSTHFLIGQLIKTRPVNEISFAIGLLIISAGEFLDIFDKTPLQLLINIFHFFYSYIITIFSCTPGLQIRDTWKHEFLNCLFNWFIYLFILWNVVYIIQTIRKDLHALYCNYLFFWLASAINCCLSLD